MIQVVSLLKAAGRAKTKLRTERNEPMPPQTTSSKAPHNRAQRIYALVVLLLSILAVHSTILATTSEDVVYQILSQKQLVQASNTTNSRVAIVEEPYGYVFIKDDTGKPGYLRYLSQATFYEYRLPRAFLKISQHREKLTLKESEELQFRAGVRKRPEGWDPSKQERNIFIDEPYRDKVVDRLFKRSHQKLNVSVVMGTLAVMGILFLNIRISMNPRCENSSRRYKLCARLLSPPKVWISKVLASPLWNGLWNRNTLVATFIVAIVGGLVMASGTMSALSITMLLFNDSFCGKQCASSSLDTLENLEVDACIEGCALGRGGRYVALASCLWLVVLLLILAAIAISIMVSKAKSFPNLSRKRWWNVIFLPLAIRPDQLVDVPVLPSTTNGNHQL